LLPSRFRQAWRSIKPLLVECKVKSLGKAAVGTVKGDIHDMGKTLVKLMFEGAGFEVIDLGIDVSKEKFINVIREEKIQLQDVLY
jgi:5-methyltetrahydrofolate--homocysteine methyltransferase